MGGVIWPADSVKPFARAASEWAMMIVLPLPAFARMTTCFRIGKDGNAAPAVPIVPSFAAKAGSDSWPTCTTPTGHSPIFGFPAPRTGGLVVSRRVVSRPDDFSSAPAPDGFAD